MVLENPTEAARREALAILPLELDDAYSGILARIQKSGRSAHPIRNLGMRVLMWLHLATRPLLLKELQHALAVVLEEGKHGNIDLDEDEIPAQKRLLDCCLGLVIVDEETMTVRFVHDMLEEYFKRDNHSITYFPDHHSLAAQIFLTYLNFGELSADDTDDMTPACESDEDKLEDDEFEDDEDDEFEKEEDGEFEDAEDIVDAIMTNFSFLAYAADHWGQYAVHEGCSDAVEVLAMKLLRADRSRKHPHVALLVLYRSLCYGAYGYVTTLGSRFLGIHAAACFGLVRYITELGKDYDWDAKDGGGRTPLSWAAARGH